jgi:hypothetical protein
MSGELNVTATLPLPEGPQVLLNRRVGGFQSWTHHFGEEVKSIVPAKKKG